MSDRNKYEPHGNSGPIEAWYLTAYALGELDEESCMRVDAWLTNHPEAKQEIDAIRQTASRVEMELASLPVHLQLDSVRTGRIKEAIASASTATTMSQTVRQQESVLSKKVRRKRFLVAVVSGIITTGLAAALAGAAFWVRLPGNHKNMVSAPTDNVWFVPPTEQAMEGYSDEEKSSMVSPSNLGRWEKLNEQVDSLALSPVDKSLQKNELGFEREIEEPLKKSGPGGAPADRFGTALSSEARGRGGLGGGGGQGLGGPGRPSGGSLPAVSSSPNLLAWDFSESKGVDGLKRDSSSGEFPKELAENVPSRRNWQEGQARASGDRFDAIPETPFSSVAKDPLSTFSIDVDTASYSKLRQYVLENNVVPPASSIRIEEWLNYFDYQYPGPAGDEPFAAHMKMGDCPWNAKHKLVRVAIQAKKVANEERPKSNLVFLIDVSGSMADANKLPLVKRTLGLLTAQLREQDRVAIVVYAGASGCVLPSTSGVQKDQILGSINELQSGGSTNGGSGIELAYKIAKENFVPGGVNRVILCTDGDFNVGVTGTDALVSMMQEQAKSNIFLTCLGYGIGNYNDSMMEQISDKGNGTYAMVDSETEARRVMTEQLSGTLMTVAKDVKIQIEFNPAKVHSYRLIGYENRRLAAADFNNDKKDAGEIGAGHRVTALYEIVPVGQQDSIPGAIDELRFSKAQKQEPSLAAEDAASKDWLLLKIRSKQPESSQSTKQEFVLGEVASQIAYEGEQSDFDWAVSVAEFGLLMRQSQLAPGMDWDKMLARAMDSTASDPYRRECLTIMQRARLLVQR
ncbi:MAG: von Willebrand factor type A domain-containing protein [Planctomycetaceae bacterium]|jgi:Ca-activated chloride channel family protein|nr:von Willebrand factor type A domain-containing protein [Planctomycetaceae bacterium]